MAKRDDLIAALIGGKAPVIVALIREENSEIRAGMAQWPGAEGWSAANVIKSIVMAKESHAELVVAMLPTTADPSQAIAALHRAALDLGAFCLTTDAVIAEAAEEIDQLELQVKAWNAAGGLSRINAAYKRYRTVCLATATSAISYSDYLHAYKLKLAALIGRNLALGAPRFTGILDIQPDLLPASKPRDAASSPR